MAISFKGAHFPAEVILMGVRWYLAYPLSTRHVEELMEERGVKVDHSTINRWVKPRRAPAFGPARHWRFAGGAFTPPLTKGMLTPPWNPSIRFPALTGGA